MPKETPKRAVRRQRPVSCLFCRSRKLRCSRDSPCTNCASRGIQCELELHDAPSPETIGPSKDELLDRIRKLEEIVEKANHSIRPSLHTDQVQIHTPNSGSECTHPVREEEDTTSQIENINSDVAWLESVYNSANRSHDELPPSCVKFRICPIHNVAMSQQSICNEEAISTGTGRRRVFWLPEYSEAKVLFNKFVRHVGHLHHVCHLPSLPGILDRVYASLNNQGRLKSGDMILVLSIFASATSAWTQHDCLGNDLFSTRIEAHRYSEKWVQETEEMIDIARRTTHVSIEGVQGIIVSLFVPDNLEFFFRRCRFLLSTALILARELGLHCIDSPANAHVAHTAQAEMGRRVWWYLVGSEWASAARMNDISQGTYQCHARHMMTNKPLNLNDEDIVDGMPRVGLPMLQPTDMTYSLYRLRLAEICRCIVDRTSPLVSKTSGSDYHVIVDIDTALLELLHEIPPFFSMSVFDIKRTYNVDSLRAAKLAAQGHIFLSLFHALRCKIHLPYFSRGYRDTEYMLSRDACIQSARLVVQIETQLEGAGLCVATRFQPLGLIMSVFIACIILLVDLCHRKQLPGQETQRNEITKAFRLLEDARQESELVAKFLDSMIQVLHKHKISPPKSSNRNTIVNYPSKNTSQSNPEPGMIGLGIRPVHPYPNISQEPHGGGPPLSSPVSILDATRNSDTTGMNMPISGFDDDGDLPSLNEWAQALDQGLDLDNFDWNDLFSNLNTSFI